MRWILLAVVLLAACSSEPDKPRRTAVQRTEAVEAALAKTPVPRTYRLDAGELRVVEVPVRVGTKFADLQRCFIFRDFEFKSTSISCEAAPTFEGLALDPRD